VKEKDQSRVSKDMKVKVKVKLKIPMSFGKRKGK